MRANQANQIKAITVFVVLIINDDDWSIYFSDNYFILWNMCNFLFFLQVAVVWCVILLFICMFVFTGGGTGFVGRELMCLLKNKGHEVTVISRQPGPGKITWVWWNKKVDFSALGISNSLQPFLFVLLWFIIALFSFLCHTVNFAFPPNNEQFMNTWSFFKFIVQDELEFNGLPPCEGVINLAGENLMNPLRWWVLNKALL